MSGPARRVTSSAEVFANVWEFQFRAGWYLVEGGKREQKRRKKGGTRGGTRERKTRTERYGLSTRRRKLRKRKKKKKKTKKTSTTPAQHQHNTSTPPFYLHRVLQSTIDGPQGPSKQHSCRAIRTSAFQKQQTTATDDGEGAVVDRNLHRHLVAVNVRVQIHVIDMNSLDDLILVFVHSPHVVRERMPVRRGRRWRQVNGGSVIDGVDQKSHGQGRRKVQCIVQWIVQCIVQCIVHGRPFSSSLWRQSNSNQQNTYPQKTLI